MCVVWGGEGHVWRKEAVDVTVLAVKETHPYTITIAL